MQELSNNLASKIEDVELDLLASNIYKDFEKAGMLYNVLDDLRTAKRLIDRAEGNRKEFFANRTLPPSVKSDR